MKSVGNIASDSEVVATASGAIVAGKPVIVLSDGTVAFPDPDSVGSATIFNTNYTSNIIITFDSDSNKVVVAWAESANNYGQAAVGTVSGTSISFGTTVTFSSTNATSPDSIVFDSNANKVAIFYRKAGVGKAIVGTVSGTDISFGTEAQYEPEPNCYIQSAAFDSNSNKIVMTFRDPSNGNYGTAIVGTISGTDISFGTAVVFESADSRNTSASFDSTNNKVVITYSDYGNSGYATGIVGTVSGTSISFGSATAFTSSAVANYMVNTYDPDQQKTIVAYSDSGNSHFGFAVVGTVSGTSISFGSAVAIPSPTTSASGYLGITYDTSADKILISNNTGGFSVVAGTVSGTTISFGSAFVIDSDTSGSYSVIAFDSSNNKSVVAHYDGNNFGKGTAYVLTLGAGGLTSENFIGFAKDAVADGAVATIQTANSIARDNMQTVTSSDSLGSAVVFEEANSRDCCVAFDSSNNKVVVAYQDYGDSNQGRAIVGTVDSSDNSISFGSPVQFSASIGSADPDIVVITFDSNANKVVIVYKDGSNSGHAIVGTVSGTSISFGTAASFNGSDNLNNIGCTFDSSNNKVVITYQDAGNSSYGTAVVGTVSGTDISFGSEAVFNSATTYEIGVTFDSSNNKVAIFYKDAGNSEHGYAKVGTVSGTSISYGSATEFNDAITNYIFAGFDSSNNKVIVAFQDQGDSNKGKAMVGTISGTSISFGSEAEFNAGATQHPQIAFDSNLNKVIIMYEDDANSDYGTYVVGTVSGTSISFGSEVVFEEAAVEDLGIAFDSNANRMVMVYQDQGNSSHGTAIVLAPTGISTDLTIGQQYFVQTDGTLSTSADDPSVIAGTAISGTDLIVKG